MKKLGVIFLCLLTFALIGVFTLYRDKIDIDMMIANLLIQQQQNAVEYTNEAEKKEHVLDHDDDDDDHDHDHAHAHGHDHAHAHGHHHDHDESEHDQHEEGIVILTKDQIKGMGLQIQTANPGKMLLILSTRGKITLDPDRLAHVIPKISGMAKEVRKNIGSYVREGEIIAVLESQDIADLKAAYLAAMSRERLASSILEREGRLYQRGVSAGQDFFSAQNGYEEARINLHLAIQKLRALGLYEEEIQDLADHRNTNLRTYNIYAPIDGTVIMRHITQGEHIENTATIYEIADFHHVWVEAGIYPKDLHRIREGQIVTVTHPENNQAAEARLIYISPIIENETITAKAIAILDNSHGIWRPGSFVKVNIAIDHIACPLLISKEAIQKVDGKDCAFVAIDKGFEKRELQLGRSDQQNIEVLSGVLPGEQYVANHSFLLKAEMNKELAEHEH